MGRERWWCLDETVGSGGGGRELDSGCGLEVQSSGPTDGHGWGVGWGEKEESVTAASVDGSAGHRDVEGWGEAHLGEINAGTRVLSWTFCV